MIGTNGTGKTTLLRCIALALGEISQAAGLVNEPNGPYVRSGAHGGRIEAQLKVDTDQFSVSLTRRRIESLPSGETIIEDKGEWDPRGEDMPLVIGYGVGRSTYGGSESGRPYRVDDSVYTLFDYDQDLIDPELTLYRLRDYYGDDEQYGRTMSAIKRALGLTPDDEINLVSGGGIQVRGPSIPGAQSIPIEAWADGYRLSFTTIIDVFAWAMRAHKLTRYGDVDGILLIDEVEQHMHPSFQKDLVPYLSELFPRMQLIVTTHSPVVVLGVDHTEVISLRWEGTRVVSDPWIPDYKGYTYEDLLEQFFDTRPYTIDLMPKLDRWQELARRDSDELSADETDELSLLSNEIRGARRSMRDQHSIDLASNDSEAPDMSSP